MPVLKPFQLLEITIISAQDLEPVSKKMKTYATAWINANRKLSTRVDTEGNSNPTWNDKFVFRVNEEFLRRDTSAVMIEIYSTHNWFRDNLVGTVRVLVGNLVPPAHRTQYHHNQHLGMRFVALQVRRPSGRPQGILNIGVAVLDSSMRSMPLYTQLSASAVGFNDLMEDDSYYDHIHQSKKKEAAAPAPVVKPILRRSKSERSERVTFDNLSATNTSMVAIPQQKGSIGMASSIMSGSEVGINLVKGIKGKKGKASSVISGAELREKPKERGKKSKASSLISASVANAAHNESPILLVKDVNNKFANLKLGSEVSDQQPAKKNVDEKSITKSPIKTTQPKEVQGPVIGKPVKKFNGYDYGGGPRMGNGKFIFGGPPQHKANSFWSDSEVGPSPSEVAAAMVVERRYPLEDEGSSVLDGWSVDESVEGLRSKLERWRTELPPIYDRGLSTSTFRSSQHARRHTDGGTGLFSCFGNIYGYECQCICGKPTEKRGASSRFHSPSIGSVGRSF